MKYPGVIAYAAWRSSWGRGAWLREAGSRELPAERLLQAIWRHQRLERERLRTLDGRGVQVLHPGFWNRGAGPDFNRALLRWDGEPLRTGDVEIDVRPAQWRSHRHGANPAYQKVILQVVWEGGSSAGAVPVLALKSYVDAPIHELECWLTTDAAWSLPPHDCGQCSPGLRRMDRPMVAELLRQAARIRLEAKARELQARARQAGWEQAVWEGVFRALGYRHNRWPMQRLAELIPQLRERCAGGGGAVLLWQARLLGLAGFLPEEVAGRRGDGHLRAVWDIWWRERDFCAEWVLPKACWQCHGLRPANHPQRRLALAAHWLADEGWLRRLEVWFQSEDQAPAAWIRLWHCLQVAPDDFWSRHWTWNAEIRGPTRPLLGMSRVTDLAINVLLPWLWMRAVSAGNEALQQRAETWYFAWPKSQDNAVLRWARDRLLGGVPARGLSRASAQQGLLQIVHDFCDQSNALCLDCSLPEWLSTLATQR